jgi:hypothetical protein
MIMITTTTMMMMLLLLVLFSMLGITMLPSLMPTAAADDSATV